MSPRLILIILLSAVVGAVLSSLYWNGELKKVQNELTVTVNEEEGLKQTSRQLKKILNTPPPTPIPYGSYEALLPGNIYNLQCFDPQKDTNVPEWFQAVKSKISDGLIDNACLNSNLNQIVYITQKEFSKGGQGSSGSSDFKLSLYETNKQKSILLRESTGNYLNEWCSKIVGWTKTDNVYYICGGGDGAAYNHERTYKVNVKTKKVEIAKNCQYENFKNLCTTFTYTEEPISSFGKH